MSSCRMRRKRLIRLPQELAKSINCDCPHRPDKLAHRATYTLSCILSINSSTAVGWHGLRYPTLLITFICISKRRALAIMSLIAATALTLPPSRTLRHHTQGWICLQYRPTRSCPLALKRKCHRHRAGLSLPVALPARRPTGATVFAGSLRIQRRLCHRQQ